MQSRRTSLTDDVAALAGPIDDELNAYLKAHADTFRVQKHLVRMLNVRITDIGSALQQLGMGSAKVLAKHSAATAAIPHAAQD